MLSGMVGEGLWRRWGALVILGVATLLVAGCGVKAASAGHARTAVASATATGAAAPDALQVARYRSMQRAVGAFAAQSGDATRVGAVYDAALALPRFAGYGPSCAAIGGAIR